MNQASLKMTFSGLAITAIGLQLVALAMLHVHSPEFDPAWRMVSEYALGAHPGVLSWMFAAWSAGTIALALALIPVGQSSAAGKPSVKHWIGWVLLVVSGIGSGSAAIFDVRSELHGLTALFGIGSLPVAALLLNRRLGRPAEPSPRGAPAGCGRSQWLGQPPADPGL